MFAIYARQSVYREDSISIESQIEHCKYETKGNEYMIYEDKGFSGKNTDRPQFQAMMNDIKSGRITHVVVYKLDRISRSLMDFAAIIELFKQYNVEFISCNEKFDTSTPMGLAMLNICIVFAQLERQTIQMRVIDAYRSRSKRGFFMGGKTPYGYKTTETVIDGIKTSMYVEEPTESEHIRIMYTMYADPANSLGDIVKYFNENGIVHNRGKNWCTSRISEMLRSPVYVMADADIYRFFAGNGTEIIDPVEDFVGTNGCYIYKTGSSKRKCNSILDDKTLVLAPHKGIISSELWLKCRVRCMNNRQSTKTNKAHNSWLSGKVKCGNCGGGLTIAKANTKMGRYFLCGTMLATKKAACGGTGGTIYADVLERTIFEKIREKLSRFDTLTYNRENQQQPKLNGLKIKLANIEKCIAELVGKISMANETLMKYINTEIEKLESERQKLNAELVKFTQIDTETLTSLNKHIENWESISFEDKQTVADTLIEVISISDNKIRIKWRI